MATRFRIHLLDMGNRIYGDCIVVEAGSKRILIDGGHPDDDHSRQGFRSLPRQMGSILSGQPPFHFDLLVVTHCHNDHIGCLPEMVADGTIQCDWALVADRDLGWGIGVDGVDPFATDDPVAARVTAALREEPPVGMSDDELAEFLDVVGKLKDRYETMLSNLEAAGTRIVRCGRDDLSPVLSAFQDVGMRYLGPTINHLMRCTEAIAGIGRDSVDAVGEAVSSDAAADPVEVYRHVTSSAADAEDRAGMGAALNDQSIVLVFEVDGKRALLTGDMQFAHPEVSGLDGEMRALRRRIAQRAPYQFVKLAHHASYNAFDQTVLDELGDSNCFGISTGRGDRGHPERSVLQVLRAHRDEIRWARTDRNGLITFDLTDASPQITCQRGSINNTRINTDELAAGPITTELGGGETQPVGLEQSGRRATVRRRTGGDSVEVTAIVPHVRTKVTLTIQVEPQDSGATSGAEPQPSVSSAGGGSGGGGSPPPEIETPPVTVDPNAPFRLAGGRKLPKLLFATNRSRLAKNIGEQPAKAAIDAVKGAGHLVLDDLPPDVAAAARRVRTTLAKQPAIRGVVLLGGYDVVPPQKLDALDPGLRGRLHGAGDTDNFIVWSDAVYGDNDGDAEQELPVSRVPDGRSSALVLAALQARAPTSTAAYGIRNLRRPFAELIWDRLSSSPLHSCEPFVAAQVRRAQVGQAGRLYFMLHGDNDDCTRFWGESAGGGYPEAFNLQGVPAQSGAVLLTGCCWGALTAQLTAREHTAGQPIAGLAPEKSIALAFLRAGVQAFIGCTGSHYSPTVSPYAYFGGPMHAAFWDNVLPPPAGKGLAPAEALWSAKKTYLAGMPHGQTSDGSIAIEMKIYHQFQCLGLGW